MKRHPFKTTGRRLFAAALGCLFALCLPLSVGAEAAALPVKEEVVYGFLSADGSLRQVTVVNCLELTESGEAVDYGAYTNLRNMTGEQPLTQTGNRVTVSAGPGRLYYEGTLPAARLPWELTVRAALNGKDCPPEDLAGQSGSLTLRLSLARAADATADAYAGYALQLSFTLADEVCGALSAPGATVARVGGSRQLTYTVLPGGSLSAEITAEVTNFEMDGITVTGLPLSLSLPVTADDFSPQLRQLEEAVAALAKGAEQLRQGTGSLSGGQSEALTAGAGSLASGLAEAEQAAEALADGAKAGETGADRLAEAAGALEEGAGSLQSSLARLRQALAMLQGQTGALQAGNEEFAQSLNALEAALAPLSSFSADDFSALAAGAAALAEGAASLQEGAAALSQQTGWQSYCDVMNQNGLPVEGLAGQNTLTASAIDAQCAAMQQQIEAAEAAGEDATVLKAQQQALRQVAQLLRANAGALNGARDYLNALADSAGTLSTAAATLRGQADLLAERLGEASEAITRLAGQLPALAAAVQGLVAGYADLSTGWQAYAAGVAQIVTAFEALPTAVGSFTEGAAALQSGLAAARQGFHDLGAGAGALTTGAGQLTGGAAELQKSLNVLGAAMPALQSGAASLCDGAGALKEQTDGLSESVRDRLAKLLDPLTGSTGAAVSFASSQNTGVRSVQFVLKTDAIAPPEEPAAPEPSPAKPLTFWQKLLRLFGLYHPEDEA